MATVLKVIKYQSLVRQLSDTEFSQFMSHLVHRCGRSAFSTPFCNQFLKDSSNNTNHHTIDVAIKIIKTIIRSRQQSINTSPATKKLDSLPNTIIGEIGSYLQQNGYISFTKTNRVIYLGCNDPNTLRELNLIQLDKWFNYNYNFVD